jgi:ankyrin repeat protein
MAIARFLKENALGDITVDVIDHGGESPRWLQLTDEDEKDILVILRRVAARALPLPLEERGWMDDGICTTVTLRGELYSTAVYLRDRCGFTTASGRYGCFDCRDLTEVLERIYENNGLLVGFNGRSIKTLLDRVAGKSDEWVQGPTREETWRWYQEQARQRASYEMSRAEAAALESVKAYHRAGGNIDAPDADGSGTRLHVAAAKRQRTVVEFLIAYGANLNARDKFGYTPLHVAVRANDRACAAMLLFGGADVDARSSSGKTPLQMLSQEAPESGSLANLLVAKRVDREMADESGRIPLGGQVASDGDLDLAVRLGNWKAARAIAAKRSSVSIFSASALGLTDQVASLLRQDPALAKSTERFGDTPLHFAAKGNQVEAARILLAAGVDVNIRGEGECSPLHVAAWGNHPEAAQFLLAQGADVNSRDREKRTPARYAPAAMLRLLAKHGADLNAVDAVGYAPLHHYCVAGQKEEVAAALDSGADINLKTPGGDTPLDLARREGHDSLIQFLEEKGGKGRKVPTFE